MIKKTFTLLVFFTAALSMKAELVILTVDMGEIYNKYHRAQEAQEKFNQSVEEAQEEIRQMIDQGRELAEQYNAALEKSRNPALTEAAQNKHRADAEEIQMQIRRKETEVNNFKQQTDQMLAARRQSALNLSLDEIKQAVSSVARQYNAHYVLNSNGLGVVYSAEGMDITKPVLDILNADKPE